MARHSRRTLAQQLVDLQISIAPAVAKIEAVKEDLRAIAEEEGQGFIEEVAGGCVELKAPRERQFKGLLPQLVPEAFLALPEGRQDKLKEQGLVVMAEQWSPAARPSVTIRLD